MRQKTSHLLIGTFVIVGTLILVFGVMAVSTGGGLRRSLEVETYFTESVQGLETGSPLRFRGVRIGEVRQISFVNQYYRTEQSYALVRVAVALKTFNTDDPAEAQGKLEVMIKKGLRVRLASQGITGALYLESDLMEDSRLADLPVDWTPLVLYVPSIPSVLERFSASVDALLVRLTKLDLEGLVVDARRTLTSLGAATDPAHPGSLAAELQQTLTTTRTTIARVEERLTPLLDSLQRTSASADQAFVVVRDRVGGKEVEHALANLSGMLAELRPTLADFTKLLHAGERALAGVDRSVGSGSRDLEAMVTNLRQISDHLRGLMESLERHPSQLFFGEPPKPVLKPK